MKAYTKTSLEIKDVVPWSIWNINYTLEAIESAWEEMGRIGLLYTMDWSVSLIQPEINNDTDQVKVLFVPFGSTHFSLQIFSACFYLEVSELVPKCMLIYKMV